MFVYFFIDTFQVSKYLPRVFSGASENRLIIMKNISEKLIYLQRKEKAKIVKSYFFYRSFNSNLQIASVKWHIALWTVRHIFS